MTQIKRFIASLIAASSLMTPAFAYAFSVSAEEAVFETPVSMRGQFIFVTRISRRSLLKAIAEAEKQQVHQRVLVRAEI